MADLGRTNEQAILPQDGYNMCVTKQRVFVGATLRLYVLFLLIGAWDLLISLYLNQFPVPRCTEFVTL